MRMCLFVPFCLFICLVLFSFFFVCLFVLVVLLLINSGHTFQVKTRANETCNKMPGQITMCE